MNGHHGGMNGHGSSGGLPSYGAGGGGGGYHQGYHPGGMGGGGVPAGQGTGRGMQRTASHAGFTARNAVRRSSGQYQHPYNSGRGGGPVGQPPGMNGNNGMGGITLPAGGGASQQGSSGSAVFRRSTSAANIGNIPTVTSSGNNVGHTGYATGTSWQNIV
jgi:hypothetical protein